MVTFEQFKSITTILKNCLQEVETITDFNQHILQFAAIYTLYNFFDSTEKYIEFRGKEEEFEDGILADLYLDNPNTFFHELIEKINKSNLHQIAEHDAQIHGYANYFSLIYFFTQFAIIESSLQNKESTDLNFTLEVLLACSVSFMIFYIGAQNSIIPQNFLNGTEVSNSLSLYKNLNSNHHQAQEFNEEYKSMGLELSLDYMSARIDINQLRLFLTRYLTEGHSDIVNNACFNEMPSLRLNP